MQTIKRLLMLLTAMWLQTQDAVNGGQLHDDLNLRLNKILAMLKPS